MLAFGPTAQGLVNGVLVGGCIGGPVRIDSLIHAVRLKDDRGVVRGHDCDIAQRRQTPNMRTLPLRIVMVISGSRGEITVIVPDTYRTFFSAFTALNVLQASMLGLLWVMMIALIE